MKPLSWIGVRVGRLLVLSRAANTSAGKTAWNCRCDCGVECVKTAHALSQRMVTSCGCWRSQRMVQRNTTHGQNGTPTWNSWMNMHQRCSNKKHVGYRNYGGRGIKVCRRWKLFANFLADMGERPKGRTLDRRDNDGNYEPQNCRWATDQQQRANRRAV